MNYQEQTILIATRLPHFFILTVSPTTFYTLLLYSSTSLSILWYLQPMNYHSGFALGKTVTRLLLCFTDIYYASSTQSFALVLYLQTCLFFTNVYINYLVIHRRFSYAHAHSIWNLISASHGFLVAMHLIGV